MNFIGEEILRKLYLEEKLTMKETAKRLGVSVGSVYNYCHKYGIEPRRHSKMMRNHPVSEETREKLRNANKGRKLSPEAKKKISEARREVGIGHKKVRDDGYIAVYFPDHPKSNSEGYIMEHVLVMGCIVGRHIRDDEVVHHKNHLRWDNRASNLQLMTKKEHMSMHTTERQHNGGIPTHHVSVINVTTGETFESVRDAAKVYGVAASNISRACRHKRKTVRGCVWKYAE